ncbi:MAG: L,D-transpeptidase family protein [Parasphingorhabdus sp.]|uniref:L,D-transpeptidase family protein n=1 Tax=Parasphingorhabdus sp. TaxID=2709688 RepID=UPI003001B22C
MSIIRVDANARTLSFENRLMRCAIGRSGTCPADSKREGDGYTPLGRWPIRGVLFRPGRSAPSPQLKLPWRWIAEDDGWSDDPADPSYNRPVNLPHLFSAETLIRNDLLYDIIIILGHNDAPPVPGNGSAIFFHISDKDKATEGCVAIARADMDALLTKLTPSDTMEIT